MSYIGKAPGFGIRNRYYYTATASQTLFDGADDNGQTLAYADSKYLDVYLNGVLLVAGTDYTATTLTSVSLTTGAAASDIVEIVAYDIFSVADTVSAANGGTFNGAVTFADDATVNGAFTSQGIDDNADATAITIDSSERVLIGSTSSVANDTGLQVNGTDFTKSSIAASRFGNDGSPPHIIGQKSRSGTIGGNTVVQNDDVILRMGGYASDGVDMVTPVGTIDFRVDGTPGSNDMPGKVIFSTTADGSNSATERMRINNEGKVGINTASPASMLTIEKTDTADLLLESTLSTNTQLKLSAIAFGTPEINVVSNHGLIFKTNDTERMSLASNGYLKCQGVYDQSAADSANVVVDGSGNIYRSTSALKYKQDVRDLESIDISTFRPVRYKSNIERDDQTLDHFGFIADEFHDAGLTELVSYGVVDEETGVAEVEGFRYDRMTVVLTKALQEANEKISALEARIEALENQ